MFGLGTLHLQQVELRGTVLHQRLLLRQIETGGEPQIVARRDELERVALERQAAHHHVDLAVEFAQREVIAHQLCGEHQARVLEVGRRLLRRGAVALDFAAYAAEQIEFVTDVGADREVVLHGRLVRRRVSGQRAVGGRFAALRRSAQSNFGIQIGSGDGHLAARLLETGSRDLEILIALERLGDQGIQRRVAKGFPPISLECRIARRGHVPGSLGRPGRWHLGRRTPIVGTHGAAGERCQHEPREQPEPLAAAHHHTQPSP